MGALLVFPEEGRRQGNPSNLAIRVIDSSSEETVYSPRDFHTLRALLPKCLV